MVRRTGGNAQNLGRGTAIVENEESEKNTYMERILNNVNEFEGSNGSSTMILSCNKTYTAGVAEFVEANSWNLLKKENVNKPGIEYELHVEKCRPIEIGRPKGKSIIVAVKIKGYDVKALVDQGANINTITAKLLYTLAENGHISLNKIGIHKPVIGSSVLANSEVVNFPAAVTLPLSRNDSKEFWVEFQITEQQPYPIILGTACLSLIGFELWDNIAGIELLADKSPSNTKNAFKLLDSSEIQANEKAKLDNSDNNNDVDCEPEFEGMCEIFTLNSSEKKDKAIKLLDELEIGAANNEEKKELEKLIMENADIFASQDKDLGYTNVVEHKIQLLDNTPFKIPRRQIPFAYKEEVKSMINKYLDMGIIRPSDSPYSSPITLVKKKNGEIRMCIDYRKLNSLTRKDAYPIPNIENTLLSMSSKKYFSSFDLISGYWQVGIAEESVEMTAFSVDGGHYEWLRMPFGLTNAPGTFERLMEKILGEYIGEFVFVYLDDILIASKNWTEHKENIRKVLIRLRESGLKLKPKKCKFLMEEIEFLGHTITKDGLKMNREKRKAIENFPMPKNVKDIQKFLGLCGYYRKFIKGFALIAKPLYALLQTKTKWEWTDECEKSFKTLIQRLCEDVTLEYPDFEAARDDESRKFVIQTDASKIGIGAILSQYKDGAARPIYFASRLCRGASS